MQQLNEMTPGSAKQHNHYFKDTRRFDSVDVYRVLDLFGVTDPSLQHAIKKLLVAGGRGAGKDIHQDIQESIDSLRRWQEMRAEEDGACKDFTHHDLEIQHDHSFAKGREYAVENFTIEDLAALGHRLGFRVSTSVKDAIKKKHLKEVKESRNMLMNGGIAEMPARKKPGPKPGSKRKTAGTTNVRAKMQATRKRRAKQR